MTSVSVIVPVYRAEKSLAPLHARLVAVLQRLGFPYEIIMVEDCGGDRSWDIIMQLAAADPHLRGFQHSRNFGQHNALLRGIQAAQNEVVITMDDDLQHPPEAIPVLLNKLSEGFDVVYGTPLVEQHGLLRDISSRWIKFAMRIAMGVKAAQDVSALRAFRTTLREAFRDYNAPYVNLDVLLSWGTTRFGAVGVRHEARQHGRSNYTFSKLAVHTLNLLTGFSTLPLRLASMTGFLFTIFGIMVLLFVLIRYFIQGGSVPGFPFLASVIAIFAGVQLFSLGIIGEYLARLYFRTMGRPASVVRSTVGFPTAKE